MADSHLHELIRDIINSVYPETGPAPMRQMLADSLSLLVALAKEEAALEVEEARQQTVVAIKSAKRIQT